MSDETTRRRFLLSAAATGIAGAGLAGRGLAQSQSEAGVAGGTSGQLPVKESGWPMFGQDLSNDGRTLSNGPEDGVSLGWEMDVSTTTQGAVVGSTMYVGTSDGVTAIDLNSGETTWTASTETAVTTCPAMIDNTVYVGTEGGTVYSFSARNGNEYWTYEAEGAIHSPVAVDSKRDHAYVADDAGYVYRLTSGAGFLGWKHDLGGSVGGSVALNLKNETVFATAGSRVYGLDFSDGNRRFSNFVGSNPVAPSVDGKYLYVANGSGTVYGFNSRNGSQRWQQSVTGGVVKGVSYLDNIVYVATDAGHVYALNTDVGREAIAEKWHTELGEGIRSPPVLSEGARTLYLGGESGTVFALNIDDGSERWSAELSTGETAVTINDGTLYAAGDGVTQVTQGSKTEITTGTPTPTPTPTPTATPESTPTPTPTPTPGGTPTPTPTPTPTSTPGETTTGAATTTTGGSGALASWLTLAGIGGLAALGLHVGDEDDESTE